MSKIAHVIVNQTTAYFPVTLIACGLIATILWTGTVVVFALGRIWSVRPAI